MFTVIDTINRCCYFGKKKNESIIDTFHKKHYERDIIKNHWTLNCSNCVACNTGDTRALLALRARALALRYNQL